MATPEKVKGFEPDVLILAIGAKPIKPFIDGVEQINSLTAPEALLNPERVEGERVLIVGGGTVGCETALYLAHLGKEVTIVEKLPKLLALEEVQYVARVLESLVKAAGIHIHLESEAVRFTDGAARIRERGGKTVDLETDTVIWCIGLKPDTNAVEALKATCPKSYRIGDCAEARRIIEAIHEGDRIGRAI
jgi:pyruvate/2-oxoglutarate dehydrogenase complex dihydrolipoamide dehydrogenase (E3) component